KRKMENALPCRGRKWSTMYFKNLPIKFDARGQASLRGDVQSFPFMARNGVISHAGTGTQRGVESLAPRPGLCSFDIDPIVRISGALDFHSVIDFDQRKSLDARASASLFRGYELILEDREPSDAIHLSSRVCGLCGGANAIASALSLEMANGAPPPPLATVRRKRAARPGFL